MVLVGKVENSNALTNILGCKVGSLPMSYLGMPLGAPYVNCHLESHPRED